MKVLLLICLFTLTALSVNRPYMHWAISSVECGNDYCVDNPVVLYDMLTPVEAIKKFGADHPTWELRCIARDYYFICSAR